MPVLVWESGADGPRATVQTEWQVAFTPEEVREEAEELDRQLDDVLDSALARANGLAKDLAAVEFTRAWSTGRAILDSRVLESSLLRNEPREYLWLALARKCRTGIRSDGSQDPGWVVLRPSRAEEPRREGRKLDYFELCLWLAEQEYGSALQTFGGSVRNGWQMLERPTLRSLRVRETLRAWLSRLDPSDYADAVQRDVFAELMKALRARWPDRGPGSAKRPVHFADEELAVEMNRVLARAFEEG